jgi:hypothetical protein
VFNFGPSLSELDAMNIQPEHRIIVIVRKIGRLRLSAHHIHRATMPVDHPFHFTWGDVISLPLRWDAFFWALSPHTDVYSMYDIPQRVTELRMEKTWLGFSLLHAYMWYSEIAYHREISHGSGRVTQKKTGEAWANTRIITS